MIQTGCKYVWIWITISEERKLFVAENLFDPLSEYGKHVVYTDGGTY